MHMGIILDFLKKKLVLSLSNLTDSVDYFSMTPVDIL
jgi:hypothetical protein